MLTNCIIVAVVAYLLGSIPFGYILVRLFAGVDVRAQGSGNIGATNVARTGKKGLAVATLLLDALKGWVAVWTVFQLFTDVGLETKYSLAAIAALCAILGHMFPVWLGFKGGKGVATGLGVFVALAPKSVLVVLIAFLFIVGVTRYVSLGSLVAAALFPITFYYLNQQQRTPATLAMISAVSLLIIWKHRDNIRRLMAGNENKLGAKKA